MQITLYNFSKRQNSTKRPSGDGLLVNVKLKNITSLYTPTFLLTGTENVTQYNYIKWEERYYYIIDIDYTSALNLYEIRTTIDTLATYKEDIQNTSAFVLYSASNYDTSIPDNRLSTSSTPTIQSNALAPYNAVIGYVVSVLGSQGVSAYYLNTESKFNSVKASLVSPTLLDAILHTDGDFASKMLNSTSECITGALFLPFAPNNLGSAETIILGRNYNTGVSGNRLNHSNYKATTINIPWQFNDFRNRNPYTSLVIYLPGYGATSLNVDDFIGETSITIHSQYDPYDGSITYRIKDLYKFDANVGVPIAVGTASSNAMGAIGSLVSSATSGDPIRASANLFNAVVSSATRNMGSVGTSGGIASASIETSIVLTTICHNTTIEPSDTADIMGRPLNKVVSLSTLIGYVQTIDASVTSDAPITIIEELNNALNGGVYIE